MLPGRTLTLDLGQGSGHVAASTSRLMPPGKWDGWIAPADLRTMVDAMPDCRLVFVPRVGHSMNLELPALHAGYFGAWFGGLAA